MLIGDPIPVLCIAVRLLRYKEGIGVYVLEKNAIKGKQGLGLPAVWALATAPQSGSEESKTTVQEFIFEQERGRYFLKGPY